MIGKRIILSKRFRNNAFRVYQYLLVEFSSKTADAFLERLEKRIDFISQNPTAGKLSYKRKDVRSILLTPHNQIFYRYQNDSVEILYLFDVRQNPKKRPY